MSQKTYIQIPIDGDTGSLLQNTDMLFSVGGEFGGGTANIASTWGWPEDCGACENGTGTWGSFAIGQTYGALGEIISVTDGATGLDKTTKAGIFGTSLNILVDASGASPGEADGIYTYSNPFNSYNWSVGDIIHIPQGIDITDSWNPTFPPADGSGAMDIVIKEEWLTELDTSPLLVDVDDIMMVQAINVDEVRINLNLLSVNIGDESEVNIHLRGSAITAMDAVICINDAIREAVKEPGSNPIVSWAKAGFGVSAAAFDVDV